LLKKWQTTLGDIFATSCNLYLVATLMVYQRNKWNVKNVKINTVYLNGMHFTTIQTDIYYQGNLAQNKNM